VAEISRETLPEQREPRLARLTEIFQEALNRLEPHCPRTPRLKTFRVLAVLFPDDFTTVAHAKKLRRLVSAMYPGQHAPAPVARHARVLQRLREVLGPPGPTLE